MKKLFSNNRVPIAYVCVSLLLFFAAALLPRETDKSMTCPQYSISIPMITARIETDGAAEFSREGKVVAGVERVDFAEDQSMVNKWINSNQDFSLFYPLNSQRAGPPIPLQSGLTGCRVTLFTDTQWIEHFYIAPYFFTVFDFWFLHDAFSVQELDRIEKSIYWGSQRADCPGSTLFFTLYHTDMQTQNGSEYRGGESLWYLWEESGQGHLLKQSGGMTLSGMGGCRADNPLWSPDGQSVVVTLKNERLTSFYFPMDWSVYTVPFSQAEDDTSPFLASGWSFPAPARQYDDARFIPLDWSQDGQNLKFSYAFTDDNGEEQSGSAWLALKSGYIYSG